VRDFKSFRFRYLFQENIMKHLTHQKEEKYAELIFNFCIGQTYYPNRPGGAFFKHSVHRPERGAQS
jgi:hypothetical protein